MELLEEVRQRRPALNCQYSIMNSVVRNLSALKIFQVSVSSEEREVSVEDMNKTLDVKAHVLLEVGPSILKR